MKKLLFAALTIMVVGSCSKKDDTTTPATPAPTANFDYTGNGAAPSTVSFSNTSTNATSYSWDFGDNNNNTSTLQNPTHSYLVGGTYTVKLIATGAGGTNSTTKTVNVSAAYTKCIITSVTISAFPATTSTGGGWDGTSAPDLFFNITDSVNTIKYNNSANVKTDVLQSQLPVTWTLSPTYNVSGGSIYTSRYIDLWEYDTPDPNDYIDYVGFRLSDYISLPNPYPSSITITRNGITATLQLTWQP
jgi:PKD repeat protein